jgi:UDP-N-acetyl-D-mannosaminuronate dehydrogenase
MNGGKHLSKETVLVIGLGEIGSTLFSLLADEKEIFAVYGLDLDVTKMQKLRQSRSKFPVKIDTMHICISCSNQQNFVDAAVAYIEEFKPKLLIIDSTVPPGTTLKVAQHCNCFVAHSPARGVHKSANYMKWEMRRWTKYVGGASPAAAKAACHHFQKLNLKVKILKTCTETELAKLFETTYRAWMIACFQEMHRISRAFGADFDETVDFLEDTHRLRFDRPVLFPGVILGHCLIPNTELLLKAYDSEFLRLILKSNEKRKNEIKDKAIETEVNKVSARAQALQKSIPRQKSKTTARKPPAECA